MINAYKDDYKSICRKVITDIRQFVGNNKIQVTIYDDYQSFVLSAIESGQHFKALNSSEIDTVDKHTIAVYYGNMYGDENRHIIRYYPELRNQQTENEIFNP